MKSINLFILLFFSLAVCSQNSSERIYLCKYNYSYQADTTNSYRNTDIMYLDIGKTYSKYYSYLKQLGLKQSNEDVRNSGNVISIDNPGKYFTDKESEIILNNFEGQQFKVLNKLGKVPFFYTEPVEIQAWVIGTDTATILNQLCQKATCNFKGRSYEAWFAPSIPLKLGPWKFNGLPGLILKIADTQQQFLFECIELTPTPAKEPAYHEYEDAVEITKEKARERKKLKVEEPAAFFQQEFGVSISYDSNNGNVPQKKKKKPYNPIELSN